MTEAQGKPLMRTFVRICNEGPHVRIRREDHLSALIYLRLVYTVFTVDGRRIHPTQKGQDLAGELHEGRDF
jgi:hypothetical protein